MTIGELHHKFSSEYSIVRYFEQKRWGKKPKCAYCGSDKLSKRLQKLRFKCYSCNRTTSVTAGTFLHGTHSTLWAWLHAFSLISNAPEGVSVKELKKELNFIPRTAFWNLYFKIRDMISIEDDINNPKIVFKTQGDGRIISRIMVRKPYRRIKEMVESVPMSYKGLILLSEPTGYNKLVRILKRIAKNHYQSYFHLGVLEEDVVLFWDVIAKTIKERFDYVNLDHLEKYVGNAIYVVRPKESDQNFEIMVKKSMRVFPRQNKSM